MKARTSALALVLSGCAPLGGRGGVSEAGPGPVASEHYYEAVKACSSACYQPKAIARGATSTGCGFQRASYRALFAGGDFAPIRERVALDGLPGEVQAVDCGQLPAEDQGPAAFAGALAEVRALALSAYKSSFVGREDVTFWLPDSVAWNIDRNELQQIEGRSIEVREYSRRTPITLSPCGDGSRPDLFCEEGGSAAALGLNAQRAYLDHARALASQGRRNGCRVAAWVVVRLAAQVAEERRDMISDGTWVTGASYLDAAGRALSEAQLLGEIAANDEAARALFDGCGGELSDELLGRWDVLGEIDGRRPAGG